MKKRKTKIKIKRIKGNLYNKRKNKTRQVVAIIITAAAACALCILGYGIGKPLMDYFRNRGEISSSSMWTPEGSDKTESSSESVNTASTVGSSSGENEPPEPVLTDSMYYLSSEAALSSASLNSELAAAKTAGHSIVVVTLKDSDGNFLYSSGIKKAECKGTLSAAQIAAEIEKAGFIPAARISTLKDKTNGIAFNCHYQFSDGTIWIDDYPGKGKTWISPFSKNALTFIKDITSELSQAGFRRIICTNTMYPSFFPIDISKNLSHLPLSDNTKRAEALWNVINSAAEGAQLGGAELYVEMDGAKLILSKKDGTDAELAYTTAPLKTANLIVGYSLSDSADAYSKAQSFIESMKKELGGAECIVRIKGSSSSAVLEEVKRAFDEAGITAFSQ